jgi:hypothetical protein
MFEDTLAYRPRTVLNRPVCEVPASGLEDDTRRFYARMASDVGVLAAGVNRPSTAAAILRTLLEALTAEPFIRVARWHRLYREISRLAAGYPLEAVPGHVGGETVLALGRMRQFLRENVDIADAPALEEFGRGRAVGA